MLERIKKYCYPIYFQETVISDFYQICAQIMHCRVYHEGKKHDLLSLLYFKDKYLFRNILLNNVFSSFGQFNFRSPKSQRKMTTELSQKKKILKHNTNLELPRNGYLKNKNM
jgi:hypothetical protein